MTLWIILCVAVYLIVSIVNTISRLYIIRRIDMLDELIDGGKISDDDIEVVIDGVTLYMHLNNYITWTDLQNVRKQIKTNAMDIIKSNLES